MAYCDIDQIKEDITLSSLIQLSNDTPGATAVDTTNVNAAIEKADILIDGFLRGAGFTVPLDPVPPLVNIWSRGLACYNLRTRRTEGEGNETLEKEKKEIVRQLEQCQAGKISLGIESSEAGFQAATIKVNKTPEDRMFGKDVLDQY